MLPRTIALWKSGCKLIRSTFLRVFDSFNRATFINYQSEIFPANENELKWIQIFRNTDSWMLKWILFNPECIFIHLYELHRAYLYAFQSKNNISIFCASWILFRIVNRKYNFFNLIKFKNNISNFCATWILLNILLQYSEYEMQFFNLIE